MNSNAVVCIHSLKRKTKRCLLVHFWNFQGFLFLLCRTSTVYPIEYDSLRKQIQFFT